MSELAPCPFCGGTEGLYPSYRGLGGGKPYAIDCIGCGMDFVPREGRDVIAAWNTRAPHPAMQEALDALERARGYVADEYEADKSKAAENAHYPGLRAKAVSRATASYGDLRAIDEALAKLRAVKP